MNRIVLIICLFFVMGAVQAQEAQAPTIRRGVWGRVVLSEGDCMPGPGNSPKCKRRGVSRRVFILEPVQSKDVDITRLEVPGNIVTDTISGADGFYEVDVPPGVYSVFVSHREGKYCNFFGGGLDQVCPVTVENKPVQFNIDINDATW